MKENEIKRIVEALLFASPEPLRQEKFNKIFHSETYNLKKIVNNLNKQYMIGGHAFEIQHIAGGYQIVSKKEYEVFIKRLLNKSNRISLSNAALDCLAIIAYKQPISRYEVEAIRGVDSTGVLKNLLSKDLVRIKGRDNSPGRPLLYKTTNKFLEYFGLNRLADMPKLKEISELVNADPSLGEQIAVFENDLNETKNEKNSTANSK